MRLNRTKLSWLLSGGALASSLVGCAAVPRPAALDEAVAAMGSPEVQELEALRPTLLAEAKDALSKAEAAYAAGDEDRAQKYAEIALNKIRTAENFAERDGALAMTESLRDRHAALAGKEAKEREDLERLRALDQRVAALQSQLRDKAENDAAVRAARKAMLDAQAKRAEAVGAGAPQYARSEYDEGVVLFESAVSALELSLLEESVTASVAARAKFESAMARALTEAAAAKQPPADAGAKADADAAILSAQAARAGAIGAGAAENNPARFGEGESLLATAERRFEGAQYASAKDLAEKAARAYQASTSPVVSPRSAATAASADDEGASSRRGRRGAPGAGDVDMNRALRSIQIAEDVRADALARGLTESDTDMAHSGYLLDSARRAVADGDAFRAEEKAREATGVLRVALGSRYAAASVGVERAGAKDSALRSRADAALAAARGQRLAQVLKPGGNECPELKAVDALLVKGEKDFQSGDYASALESGVRAVERVGACASLPKAGVAPAPGAAPASAAALLGVGQKLDDPKAAALAVLNEARVAVAVAKATEAPRASEAEALLNTAETWFARGDHGVAETLAKQAIAALATTGVAPRAKPGSAEAPAVTKEAARVAIVRAQRRRAERSNAPAATLARADRLLESAQSWFDKASYSDAKAFADDALAVLDGKDPAPAQPGPAKPGQPAPAPGAAAPAGTPRVSIVPVESEQGRTERRSAEDAISEAMTAKRFAEQDLQPSMQASFARGESLLRDAQGSFDDERYDEARSSARAATAVFETVRAAPRAAAPGDKPTPPDATGAPKDPAAPSDKKDPPKDVEKLAEERIVRFKAEPGASAPDGWQDAYRKVIRALKLRDSAAPRAKTPEERASFARGVELLQSSQRAWDARQLRSAAGYADRAADEFLSLGATESSGVPTSAAVPKPAATKASAEAAVREAETVLAVCNREGCVERGPKEFVEGKVLLETARKELEAGKLAEAREAAEGARRRFTAALEQPRKDRPAPKDAPDSKRQRDEASDQLREVEVQRKLCEQADCAAKDLEAWLRAESNAGAARAALSDGDYVRAKLKAKEAVDGLKQVLDALKKAPPPPVAEPPKGIVVPAGVSGVSVDGDRITVSPAFDFQSGSAVLTQASLPSVQQLARVLIDNQGKIASVNVVGFTDSRGNAALNKALSKRRAQAVVDALVRAGVPRAMLSSDGRGADDPIADNETPEGRSLNRRVEIRAVMR